MFPTVDTEDIPQVTSLNRFSTSRDVSESIENTEVAKHHNNRELTLNMLIKEIVFCIALALTTYGALHNTPTKVSKHPQAVRFFSTDSVVTDWYRGQLSNALVHINRADVSFVMYYAPWDAESQYVRGQFEKAARILHDRVYFAAINCWNPGSECRLQHNKIPSWPILMAYTVTSRGVLYKGPRDAYSMVNFMELIMRPLKRISTTEGLVNLLSICDAVAVGYTPLIDTSKYYNIWYNVALKVREFDTVGEICFAAVTSEGLAVDLGVETLPNARLMLWNDTKEYIEGEQVINAWNESALLQWVLENFAQPVARVIPMWKKAFSFERYIDGNPLLMLFTPMNPLYEQIPSYALLREVAMEFYNCDNNNTSQWVSELIKLQQVQRLLYQQKDFMNFCDTYKFKKSVGGQNQYLKKEVVAHNNKYPWNNRTQKNEKGVMSNFFTKRGLVMTKSMKKTDNVQLLPLGLLDECCTVLPAEKCFNENYEECQSFEKDVNEEWTLKSEEINVETTMLPSEDDPLSPENLTQDNVEHFCKLMKFANEWGAPVFPKKVSSADITRIHGLACANNFTLYMIAVDSVRNHHFAESLGIDITNKKDMTAVVILDSKLESQYVLSEEYSAKSVRDFIYNYTRKNLKRTLRSHIEVASHTHYFGSEGESPRMGVDNNTVHIIDLTTHTFRKVVRTPGTVTLVAVCGGSGGCGALPSRALLDATRLLSACGVRAQAARLDALRHDLPWHYTMHTYPTVLVFPPDGDREADSRAYPMNTRITSSGLVALAMRALGAPQHLRVRLALCATTRSASEKKICLKDIKEHITTVVDRNLKYWRQSKHKVLKDALFKRLQHLHRVYLELSIFHISDLNETSNKHRSLLDALSALSSNWDIDITMLRREDKSSTPS